MDRVPFTCTLDCGSRCELFAEVSGDHVLRIDTPGEGTDTDDRPRLVPCARGRSQGRARTTAERLTHPLRRAGPRGSGLFERVTWESALDEVATKLTETRNEFGASAVLHATGAGSISGRGFNGSAASGRFFSYWDSVTAMRGNMSYHCGSIAAQWMLGSDVSGSDRATLLDSRLIILWGMNPAETHMGPNTAHFIAQARDRGARVVLIDPRYTDSGILADQWIPIRPGSDAALAAAVAYVLETDGLANRAFMDRFTTGYDAYRRYLLGDEDGIPKTPEWAAAKTGVSAPTIRQLARDYATVKPAALLPGWGPQRTLFGEQSARAMITLACLSGNVGIRGGGAASVGLRLGSIPVGKLPRGPHDPARHLSTITWAKNILDGALSPSIKMVYIVASNLLNRSPNTLANARALDQADLVVVQDPFLTPTARCADIALPICTDLERADLVTSWGHDSHLFYSQQAAPPAGESRTDHWVFAQLAQRMGFHPAYTRGRAEAEWMAKFLNSPRLDVNELRENGVMREDCRPRVALASFRTDPEAHPLPTSSGRIEICCPQAAAHGLPVIPSYVEAPSDGPGYPLQLVTPHHKFRSNSCLYAVPWLRRLETHAVWINPRDADPRDIRHGDEVEVSSESGAIRLPAKVTQRIMPGVVCVYQGTWYRPGRDGVDEGGCANVLTGHSVSPSGGCATHSAWVEVRRSQ